MTWGCIRRQGCVCRLHVCMDGDCRDNGVDGHTGGSHYSMDKWWNTVNKVVLIKVLSGV